MREARQGVGQSNLNRVEGRTDCATQEQSCVEGRAELKANADNLCFFFTFFLFIPYFILHEIAFSFWDAVIENPSGLRVMKIR